VEVGKRFPHGRESTAVVLLAHDRRDLVQVWIHEIRLVDQDDLVAGLASVGEDVLDGAEVGQVLDFRAQLLPDFADDALAAILAEADRAAQWAVEFGAGRRVAVLGDEDPVAVPEDAYHDGPDLSWFHRTASIGAEATHTVREWQRRYVLNTVKGGVIA